MQFATGNGDTTVGRRWTYVCIAGYEVEPGVNQVSIDCVAPGIALVLLLLAVHLLHFLVAITCFAVDHASIL